MPAYPTTTSVCRRLSDFGRYYPGAYLRAYVRQEVATPAQTMATLLGLVNQWRTEDEASSEPAHWWNCDSIPNASVLIPFGSHGDLTLRIYTVQRGTHHGKRIIKVTQEGGNLARSAAGFLNCDGSFTPWNSSMWSGRDDVHAAIRSVLVTMANHPDENVVNGVECSSGLTISQIHYNCLICNGVTWSYPDGGRSRFCTEHMPAENLSVFGRSLPSRVVGDSTLIRNAVNRVAVAARNVSEATQGLRDAAPETEDQTRRRLGHQTEAARQRRVAESARRARREERQAALAAMVQAEADAITMTEPLLSQLGTGKVR